MNCTTRNGAVLQQQICEVAAIDLKRYAKRVLVEQQAADCTARVSVRGSEQELIQHKGQRLAF